MPSPAVANDCVCLFVCLSVCQYVSLEGRDLESGCDGEGAAVLGVQGDLTRPVQQHLLICQCVVKVESIDVLSQPELSHFQTVPPGWHRTQGTHLTDVLCQIIEQFDEVSGDWKKDGVLRNFAIFRLTVPGAQQAHMSTQSYQSYLEYSHLCWCTVPGQQVEGAL